MQRAFLLLESLRRARLQPKIITFSMLTSVCEKDSRWQRALGFWEDKWQAWLQPNVFTFKRASSASAVLVSLEDTWQA